MTRYNISSDNRPYIFMLNFKLVISVVIVLYLTFQLTSDYINFYLNLIIFPFH